jgi:ABC-2 type transport system permease protein
MLKGNSLAALWPDIWPIGLFTVVVILLGLGFYRRTLD